MLKKLAALLGILLTTCGIEEYYYLPQVPAGRIGADSTIARIDLPAVSTEHYYATNYRIFYRIYISDLDLPFTINPSNMSSISPYLSSDYNALYPLTDPANISSITSLNSFRGRNYYELELSGGNINNVLSKNGGILSLNFLQNGVPPNASFASFNGGQSYSLQRSTKLLPPDKLFFYNNDLLSSSNDNADVARQSSSSDYAYVSMYIVLEGFNPVNFSTLYSKPTHISVFKLPNS